MRGLPYRISWFLREVLLAFRNAVHFSLNFLKTLATLVINEIIVCTKAIYRFVAAALNYLHQAYLFFEGKIIGAGVYLWNLLLATKLVWIFVSPYIFVPYLADLMPLWRRYFAGALVGYSVILTIAITFVAWKSVRDRKTISKGAREAIVLDEHARGFTINRLRIPFRILISTFGAILYILLSGRDGAGVSGVISLFDNRSVLVGENNSVLDTSAQGEAKRIETVSRDSEYIGNGKNFSFPKDEKEIGTAGSASAASHYPVQQENGVSSLDGLDKHSAVVVPSVLSARRSSTEELPKPAIDLTGYSESRNGEETETYPSRRIQFSSLCQTEINVAVRYYSHEIEAWVTSGWLRIGREMGIDVGIGQADSNLYIYAYSGALLWKKYWRGRKGKDESGLIVMGEDFSYISGNYPKNQSISEITFTKISSDSSGNFGRQFACEKTTGVSFLYRPTD